MTAEIIPINEGRIRVLAAREAKALADAEKNKKPAELVHVVFGFDAYITFETLQAMMEVLVAAGHMDVALDIRSRAIVVQP